MPFQLGGSFNRFSYHLARQVMWQGFRRADTLARRNELELPAAPFWGPYNGKIAKQNPVLYGFSPSVIPQPPDWGDENQITGYWFLEPVNIGQLPSLWLNFSRLDPLQSMWVLAV